MYTDATEARVASAASSHNAATMMNPLRERPEASNLRAVGAPLLISRLRHCWVAAERRPAALHHSGRAVAVSTRRELWLRWKPLARRRHPGSRSERLLANRR